ncbi:MAG: class II fructose-bisphosphate aldolase, partial [Candidatus Paceibacterota bacterium]
METLRQIITRAEAEKKAIGHFNISNLEGFWGVVRAAKDLNQPIIIGLSEGERDFIGLRQAKALVESAREEFDFPIFLSADHTFSLERAQEAIKTGFDLIVFDRSELPFEENINETKKCVEYAHSISPEILVEGELGYIGKSSKILDELPSGVAVDEFSITKVDEAGRFVKETAVDLFSPAVGNIHGILKNAANPQLFIGRIKEIKEATGVPLVLHGGSGLSDEDFGAAIEAGITIIHINTELRIAYRQALVESLQENPEEIAPYKYLKSS